ncbi:unnamed protein product [Urochloa humidicola]
MSFRALGSLLTRRLALRGIPLAQAESSSSLGIGIKKALESAAGRPAARSLYTLRRLTAGDGSYGARAAAAASLAGFFALLYFNKDTKKSAGEVTGVEPTKEVPHVVIKEDAGLEDLEVDEEAMQSRFEDWMKEYGRSYKSKEEKARRYQIFKEGQISADRHNKRNASKPNGAHFGTTAYSDWTQEEVSRMYGCDEAFDWKEYSKAMIADERLVTEQDTEEDVLARLRAKGTKHVSNKPIRP